MRLHLLECFLVVLHESDPLSTIVNEALLEVCDVLGAHRQRFEEDGQPVVVCKLVVLWIVDHIDALNLEIDSHWVAEFVNVKIRVILVVLFLHMEADAFHMKYILHRRTNQRRLNKVIRHDGQWNLILHPLFPWIVCVNQVANEVLILLYRCVNVHAYFARHGRRSHRDSQTVVEVKLMLDQVNALKATEHVLDWQ